MSSSQRAIPCRPFSFRPVWILLAAALALCLPGTARADALDVELLKQAKTLVTYLKNRGAHNVGVLRFREKTNSQSPHFLGGELNVNLTERLENALVLSIKEDDNIRILHNAGDVIAARGEKLSYLKDNDRKKIFAMQFPVAWGNQRVTADVFFTGMVTVNTKGPQNRPAVEIAIQAFGAKVTKDEFETAVVKFSPKIDWSLLSDLAISKRSSGGATADFDDDPKPQKNDPPLSDKNSRVELLVRYDGADNSPQPDPSDPSKELLPTPKQAGQQVQCLVRNKTDKPVAIVLKVNGISTSDSEEKPIKECRLWVLEPGRQYAILGYYITNKEDPNFNFKLTPFKTFIGQEWEAMQSSFKAPGVIELAVFVSQKSDNNNNNNNNNNNTTDGGMKISLRGLSKSLKDRQELTLGQLQTKIQSTATAKRALPEQPLSKRHIGKDPNSQSTTIEMTDFSNPVLVEDRFIVYWKP
jgi:hypothetical protein